MVETEGGCGGETLEETIGELGGETLEETEGELDFRTLEETEGRFTLEEGINGLEKAAGLDAFIFAGMF